MDQTYMEKCDVCGEDVPATEAQTVQWANVTFCSDDCRQSWLNSHQHF